MIKKYLLLIVLNTVLNSQATDLKFNDQDPLGLRAAILVSPRVIDLKKEDIDLKQDDIKPDNWQKIQQQGYFMVGQVQVPLLDKPLQKRFYGRSFVVGQVRIPLLSLKK